jgi:hypothetical protein
LFVDRRLFLLSFLTLTCVFSLLSIGCCFLSFFVCGNDRKSLPRHCFRVSEQSTARVRGSG